MSDTGSISGTLIDQRNNLPIAGATAQIQEGGAQSASTDAKGKFAFQNLPAGKVTLTIGKQGYQEGIFGPLAVIAGQTMDLRLAIRPSDA